MMQRGTKRNGCFFYLTLAQLSQTKHAQQFSPCAADLRPEIRAGQIVWLDGLRPEIMDHRFHQRQSRLIGQKARIDGGRIGDHPEPETRRPPRSEEHPSELQSLMRISYACFCLKK